MKFSKIEQKILAHARLNRREIEFLLSAPAHLLEVASYADGIKNARFGRKVFYGNNLNINPTNICEVRCPLCAFSRDENEPDAYCHTIDAILERIRKFIPFGLLEVHIVGGLYDKLKLDYYQTLLREIKNLESSLYIQAFTAVEIDYFARLNGLTVRETLGCLKDAGLDSMPGGGAEIFNPKVRKTIAPEKIDSKRYFEIMKIAHEMNISTNVTMLYGHIETRADIADHLVRIRDFQDESGGVMTFVPLAFHKKNTRIERALQPASGVLDLTVLAVARIVLANVPHIKSLWTYLGRKMTQVALEFGADDIGATALDERIAASAGAVSDNNCRSEDLKELIIEAGLTPVLCDSGYNPRKEVKTG